MADEVPVCEVLCEAMEYLSKLGTNLRTRSDALKEKRIRADKLKNTHAVQKAAKKVLLICELSKKSLDNVESGVKRILTLVDTSQASTSDGGKSSTGVECSASEKKNHFHYFEYNKRKLKITKKIPIKHYMSAKVVFKAMSKSTQDKYPVYHDCKLFRVRRRKAIIEKLKKIESERRRSTKESADEIHTESEKDGVRRKRLSQSESPKKDEIHKNEIKGRHSSEISNSGKHRNANYGSESELSKENDNNTIVKDSDDAHLSPRKTKGELKLLNLKDTRRHRTSKDSDNDSDKGDESKGTVSNSEESQEAVIAKKDSIKEARKQLIDTSSESDPKEEPKSIDLSDSESKKDFKETKDESNDDVEGDNERKSGDKTRRSSDSSDRSENGDKSRTVSRKHRKDSGSDKKSKGGIHKERTKDKLSERKKSSHASRESDSPKKKTEKLNRSNSREHRKDSDSKKSNEQGSKDKRKHEENHSKRRKPVIEDSDNSKKESEKHGDKDVIDLDDGDDDDKKSGSLKATDSDADEKKEVCKRDESRKVRKQVNSDGDQESRSPAITNKVIDSDSDVDDDNRNNKSKNKETIDTDNKQNKDEDETSNADKQDEDIEPKRPLIKLVSMSKLLKPDVLQKVETVDKNVGNKTKIRESRQSSSSEKNNSKNTKKKVRCEDEEEFWVLRRKEVEAFRPKDITINITRLPKLSVDILDKYNIKKVIQNGSVICEETENLTNRSSDNADKTQEDYIHLPDLSTLKSALLFDSDSDSSGNGRNREKSKSTSVNLALDNENVKKSLLHESDSDKSSEHQKDKESEPANEIENVTSVIEENDKNDDKESKEADEHQNDTSAIENNNIDDDSSKQNSIGTDNNTLSEVMEKQNENNGDEGASELRERNNKSPVEENASKVNSEKMSLLNDSSEDSTGPANKRKRRGSTPHSKRKHIMESMHAKKMLLTYSSSSETEDEKLNGILKKIKKSLLEGDDSDEDSKESHRRKILESSDSGEDILKTIKKTRKIKSKRSSQEQEKEESKDNHDEETNVEAAKDSESIIEQVDGTMDETSNSDGSKMGRSREKPSGSSSHNSDTQDDKAVDGLTNIKSLTRPRRRRDSNSSKAESSSKRDKMPKVPSLITGEGLLEIPSSSEASAAESDAAEDDLPAVNLSGLNGSGITHLAKDDLLGDSDSSSKSSEEKEKDDESDTEEKLKLKRRKAHAISSDSEAGSSRRKNNDKDVRLSDFEDSGDDSEPTKKNKRKKKASDSDASAGSSNEGKKKRRRIKEIDSDGSMSDTENEGRKHGRKNIRKVMGKNQLEEATKRAARQERERMARIVERQKVYNNLQFDESGKPDEVVLDKVVLDFDPETKEPLIELDRGLVKKLKPHQANGIKFMWDACFESVKRIKKDRGSGCILAHCMGLGKTLQVVSLTHTLLIHSELTSVQRVLVVCPLSTVLNWVHEFRMWLKHAENDFEVDVYELSKHKQNSERAFQLSQWFAHGGVCVLGYEMFRNLSSDTNKKFKKKMLRNFQESLVDPGPDMVVCDEGHLLKNEKTSLSQSMNRVKTHRRIVLTGTPLQNNLKEYYCMVQFVKPNLLGKYNEYLNRFVNPITNGQYTDSNEHDIRVMKRRSHVLHKMLDGAVQRRDYGVLAPFLPPKHEYVLFITLTDVQVKLYQNYLDNYSRRPLPGKSSGFLFPDFQSLQRIWTHPLVLKYNSERYEIMQQKKREREEEDSEGSLADFIDDESTPDESSTEESSDDLSDVSDDSRKKSKKKAKKGKGKDSKAGARRGTRANPGEIVEELENDDDVIEVKNENPTEWWIPLVTEDEIEDLRNSHKLVLLFEILRQCEAIGDKLLVFSQSLYSLDLIEHFLGKVDEATQDGRIDEKLGSHVGSWSPGVDYFRLDGSTSCENRSIWCKNFNREDNPRARLFLISTRAGGLGINLVAANRVIIFDVSWNPSHDVQSIFRVYRFGQKKPCYVYRFLAMGTMEEKIYERQVTKQAISKRVIDEQQIDRHYAENDLAELYKFEPRPPAPRPVPLVPKDRLFAEMLKEHGESVYKFHEHDSLLENKEEETLSEEERKAAWEDFENEKNKPPPAPFTGWPMHNGMVPNLMAQQQQQLAYAALAGMLRKDMPNVTDDQIRGMIPLIYGANPSLMQKLNDLYKYPQPSMMNPAAMMNSVMNSGGAAGAVGGVGGMGGAGGGGGTSGLQYEPPWAREQHQLRLQQLMQQQNQMGAKYYAGGLGSRDPVAMAMQQQRAREIMLGERGRARGRPPLQARATHAPAGDVVNLDSD